MLLTSIVTTISMIAVGMIVWRLLQWQERRLKRREDSTHNNDERERP